MALFIQKRISEVFAVNILPEEKIESLMLLNKATGSFDGETDTGKNVIIYHGKVYVCQNKSPAKESPKHPANLAREILKVKDGYFHQGFYRDEEPTASGCQAHGAEISQDCGIQLVQADHGSANSTQVASPPLKYKATAPSGNIRDDNGQPLHCINDAASSSQARPTNRCYQPNLSISANKFPPYWW